MSCDRKTRKMATNRTNVFSDSMANLASYNRIKPQTWLTFFVVHCIYYYILKCHLNFVSLLYLLYSNTVFCISLITRYATEDCIYITLTILLVIFHLTFLHCMQTKP